VPVYVRAGSIIPYGSSVQWATERVDAPIELRIYPGANGEFTLYEDEGARRDSRCEAVRMGTEWPMRKR
jgi:alpha-D-xyloside xylohydrolase